MTLTHPNFTTEETVYILMQKLSCHLFLHNGPLLCRARSPHSKNWAWSEHSGLI